MASGLPGRHQATAGVGGSASVRPAAAQTSAPPTPARGGTGQPNATLLGEWRVGPVVDRARPSPPADLAKQLGYVRLPVPGELVRSMAGQLCVGSVPCGKVTWYRTRLGEWGRRSRVDRHLSLPASTPFYLGRTSDQSVSYKLLPRPDGSLSAVVYLFDDPGRGKGRRVALERWRPATPDARMAAEPPGR